MKTRRQKDEEIELLKREFNEAANALILQFTGVRVSDDERLRRELREANLSYRVIKNTLAHRAASGTPLEQVRDVFKGPTAVAISRDDPVTLAKILAKWAKESPAFTVKAGIVEGLAIEVQAIEAISNLPTKEELLSRIMFLVNSGAQRLASATAGVARNLTIVIDQARGSRSAA